MEKKKGEKIEAITGYQCGNKREDIWLAVGKKVEVRETEDEIKLFHASR